MVDKLRRIHRYTECDTVGRGTDRQTDEVSSGRVETGARFLTAGSTIADGF